MNNTICGYVVLRKPEYNFIPDAEFTGRQKPPGVDGVYYGGFGRWSWLELRDGFERNALPDELINTYIAYEKSWDSFFLRDFSEAKRVLDFSNKEKNVNEIATFFSDKLANAKGTFKTEQKICWLGKDIFDFSFGSHLVNGYFFRPNLFNEFRDSINPNGLFGMDSNRTQEYIETYIELSKTHKLEHISLKNLDVIKVGKILY